MFNFKKSLVGIVSILSLSAPIFACACGCGLFDVGTGSMLPVGTGTRAFIDYTLIDQNKNWSGSSEASMEMAEMSGITTYGSSFGIQHIFNRSWGAQLELPYLSRTLTSTDSTHTLSGLGDVRLKGFYTGLSADMSMGLTVGIKLPTGPHDSAIADRDTQLGTGSTDLLLGAYARRALNEDETIMSFYTAQLSAPLFISGDYRPGAELNGTAGIYYKGISYGNIQVTPLAQIIGTSRATDSGTESDPDNSGYTRVVLSTGLEVNFDKWRIYSDAGFPLAQQVNGTQLVASNYVKITVGCQL